MNTSRRAGVIATQRPMSSRTLSSVSADSQIVPDDQACSFDFVYASGGQQPDVVLDADALDGRGRDAVGDDEIGVEREMRTVLLDRPERLHEDRTVGDQPIEIGRPQFVESAGCGWDGG